MPQLGYAIRHEERGAHNLSDYEKSIRRATRMGHSLQMNTLRTGKAEEGGSNESGQ